MLKIKDNVDLKELEKYGFKDDELGQYSLDKRLNGYTISIYVYTDDINKYINIQNDNYDCSFSSEIPNVIYDLIKDGLVEKVSDK